MASDLFVLYSLLRRLMTRKCTTHKSKFPLDLWQNTCFPWCRFDRSEVLDTVLKLAPNMFARTITPVMTNIEGKDDTKTEVTKANESKIDLPGAFYRCNLWNVCPP
jgi:hypothetical protein